MDSVSEVRLQLVAPQLSAVIHRMADALAMEGIYFRVTQGLRTMAEQAALYAQGRTTAGEIVTDAKPGESWHCYGLAVDVVLMNPEPDWDIANPAWQRIIAVGISLGLESGSTWTHPDNDHFQFTGSYPVSPTPEAIALLNEGGPEAVWQNAFA